MSVRNVDVAQLKVLHVVVRMIGGSMDANMVVWMLTWQGDMAV
jgi:hypothetical protein